MLVCAFSNKGGAVKLSEITVDKNKIFLLFFKKLHVPAKLHNLFLDAS
jgi:hypothetical protein